MSVSRILYFFCEFHFPLLCERIGEEVWVKHENHNPTGSFKVRGGIVYLEELVRQHPDVKGVVSATRGNHGQSIAFSAARKGLRSSENRSSGCESAHSSFRFEKLKRTHVRCYEECWRSVQKSR